MKKPTTILLVLVIATIATVFLLLMKASKKRSDDILSKFNEIDRSLYDSTLLIHTEEGPKNVQQLYMNASLKSEIIVLIDSLKERIENLQSTSTTFATQHLHPDVKRLLAAMQQYNQHQWDKADSQMPDTISYWKSPSPFSEQKWYSTFFDKVPGEVRITYLNYLRNELLKTY